MKKSWEEKCSLDGAANVRRSSAQNYSFLVPHEKDPGSNPKQGKQLKLFQGILYLTTLYYNDKSDFDTPEVYDMALRLKLSVPMVRKHVSAQPLRGCVIEYCIYSMYSRSL